MPKFGIRKLVLWLTGIMIVSLSISGVLFVTTGGVSFKENNSRFHKVLDQEKTFDMEGLEEINFNITSTDVNFIPIDGDELKVHFYGKLNSFTAYSKEIFAIKRTGNTLNIAISLGGIGIINFNSGLDVYIPKSYNKNIDFKSSSSDVSINDLKINNFNYKNTSGDLKMDSFRVNDSKFTTTSGQIIGKEFSGDLVFDSVSGDMSIDYEDYNNDIEIETTSGDVEIGFSNDPEFYLKIKTSSGNITNQIPITMTGKTKKNYLEGNAGNSENRISIKTTSGDVELKK